MSAPDSKRLLVLLALLAAVSTAGWVLRPSATPSSTSAVAGEPIDVIVVDLAFAMEHRAAVEAIEAAGGAVRIFDFPGADSESGHRFPWARDFGPLPMPGWRAGRVVWDALNGGATNATLEHQAVPRLAAALRAEVRRLDLVVQGGNWYLLPDRRVITTTKILDENPERSRQEIESLLADHGVTGLIVVEPLPGELTRHADLVLNVDPRDGHCLVGQVWPEAIASIPGDEALAPYRALAVEMAASLDRTAAALGSALGSGAVSRVPQPLPYLDPRPEGGARAVFPSYVNGLFVSAPSGATRYLYGIAGDLAGVHYYAYDAGLVERYEAAMAAVGERRGFEARGVPSGDLILGGGSLHCTTVEAVENRAER